jgi:hypothetical protein
MKQQPEQYTVPANIVKLPSSLPIQRPVSSYVHGAHTRFVNSVEGPGMVLGEGVKLALGMSQVVMELNNLVLLKSF